MTSSSAKLSEHKKLFECYINNIKNNCKLISRVELEKVKTFLETKENFPEIDINLKRRISSNKYFLFSLDNGIKSVYVPAKDIKV